MKLSRIAIGLWLTVGCSAESEEVREFSPTGPYEPTDAEQEVLQLYQDGRLITARRKTDALLEALPYSILGHYVLGQVYRESEGQLPKSMKHLGRARELLETRYPSMPLPEGPMRELHREVLFAAQGVAGEIEEFEYQLQLLDFYDSLYSPELTAEHAWPLMRLGQHAKAREFADKAIQSSVATTRSLGLNAMCAIEGEAATRQPRFDACLAAFEDALARARHDDPKAGPDERTAVAVHAYNAAEAAMAVLRPDEVERLAIAGTAKLDFTPANPWRVLTQLYLDQARIDDGVYALQEMLRWRGRQPPYLRDQDRAQTDVAQATLLMAVGRTEAGLQLVDRALKRPDRRGLTSSTRDQAMGAHAVLRMALRRADAEHRAERSVWDSELPADTEPDVVSELALQPIERIGRNVADRERIRNLLRDEARLLATFRVYVHGGLEPLPLWLVGDLVDIVGPGVARVTLEQARAADEGDGYAPYYDALEAEVALAEGEGADALVLVDRALGALPQTEALLRARVAAVGAQAAASEGDTRAELGYLAQVMQLDPGTIRRRGLALPMRIDNASTGEVGARVAELVEDSPRVRSGSDFTLEITGSGRALRMCVSSPEGAELSCTIVDFTDAMVLVPGSEESSDGGAVGDAEAAKVAAKEVPMTDAQAVARTLEAFHDRAFGFGLELSAIDLRSLDGRTVVAEEATREKMQSVLDEIATVD